MPIRRITLSDIVIGQPLPWDVFSTPSAPHPLLPKGKVIEAGELDGFLASGLFADAGDPVSVLQSLHHLNFRLERTLDGLRGHAGADAALRGIAGELIATVARQPDIALAALFLNQIAGTYPVRHCTETAIIACTIATALGKPAAEMLVLTAAALTMNVGMARQASPFDARSAALTPAERASMHHHPQHSVDMLRGAGVTDEAWLELVLLHHENDDGSGYPDGRRGDGVSQNARLIGLSDRYCAMVSPRNYRRALLPPAALERLATEIALPADRTLMIHFGERLGAYPPGTLVQLASGAIGVVAGQRRADGDLPVHLLRAADGTAASEPSECLSSEPGCAIAQALHEDQARVRFSMRQVWGELASL